LTERLNLNQFGVLGVSGGGPYAAACAARIPTRLSAVILVCSVAPADSPEATKGMVALNRCLLSCARRAPWLAQYIGVFFLKLLWGKGQQVIPEQIEARLGAADRKTLASPALRQTLVDSSMEALHGGLRAAVADGLLYGRSWGFRLEDIRIPTYLWHGEKDVVVPPTMGRYLAKTIPECRATFCPEDGHFSLPFGRLEEILKETLPRGHSSVSPDFDYFQ